MTTRTCPVCGGDRHERRWRITTEATEGGVAPEAFRPSAERFGTTAGEVVRCTRCGHMTLAEAPAADAVSAAYAGAADPVSLREEAGQVATAHRALRDVEGWVRPGRLVDLGCWTGSFLIAASERGWETVGVEPSAWASQRARDRGLDVRTTELETSGLEAGSFDAVAMCDVIEHLTDPGRALDEAGRLLRPGGALFMTLPDAGSLLARAMGRRWWSVLPMHVQYFTRDSLRRLLLRHGFSPRSFASHAKVFSARYYAERLGGYATPVERAAVGVAERLGMADRLVAPDFRDRMAVIATRD